MRTLLPVLTLAVLGGCKQFYTVDEACHDKVPRENLLQSPAEIGSFNRLNCHRRLIKLLRAKPGKLVQESQREHLAYVRANPSSDVLLGNAAALVLEDPGSNGFTGATIFERMDNKDYTFPNVNSTSIQEIIWVDIEFGLEGDKVIATGPDRTPEDATDHLMRYASFRELGLSGSWFDGAYAEVELDAAWLQAAGWDELVKEPVGSNGPEAPESFKIRYWTAFRDVPQFEKFEPYVYPKDKQTAVPLWSPSTDLGEHENLLSGVQIGYPITIHGAQTDPTGDVAPATQNYYDLSFERASLVGPNGPENVWTILPGDKARDRFPDGYGMRSMMALHTYEPLLPGATYTLYADILTSDGPYDIDMSFTTAALDEGVVTGTWDGEITHTDNDGVNASDTGTGTGEGESAGGGGGGGNSTTSTSTSGSANGTPTLRALNSLFVPRVGEFERPEIQAPE